MNYQVVIVEDNNATRKVLHDHVNKCEGFEVMASHSDFSSAMDALDKATPHVLLVDLDLPDGDGIDIISRESCRHPELSIMVISVFGDENHVVKAIQAGAQGYLLKDSDSVEIEESIRQLLDGGSPISPSIARHLIKRFQVSSEVESAGDDAIGLSEREKEVLVLASKGFSYTETATMLNLSVNTIASYTKRVYGKLAVNSRSEAVFEATRRGIMNKDHWKK